MVPLADVFDHKASVVHLSQDYEVARPLTTRHGQPSHPQHAHQDLGHDCHPHTSSTAKGGMLAAASAPSATLASGTLASRRIRAIIDDQEVPAHAIKRAKINGCKVCLTPHCPSLAQKFAGGGN
jgi:hypothetical protein